MLTYTGASKQRMDDRGRFHLPQRWQDAVQQAGELVITAGPNGSLWLCERETWEAEVGRLGAELLCSPERQMLRSLLVGHAETVSADKNHRILVSEALRTYADLDNVSAVYLVGSGSVIEIWDWRVWEQRVQAAKANTKLFDLQNQSGSNSTESPAPVPSAAVPVPGGGS